MQELTIDQLHKKMSDKESYFHLDVRQPEEFQLSHIQGSILIPLGELPSRIHEIAAHQNEVVIVSCKSGGRSARAIDYLKTQGFTNLWNLVGGNDAWQTKYS